MTWPQNPLPLFFPPTILQKNQLTPVHPYTWLKSWNHEIWSRTAQTGHWLCIPIPQKLLKCFLNLWIVLALQWSFLGSSISKCMRNEWRFAPPWWRSQQGFSALELVSICSFELPVQFSLFNFLLQEQYEKFTKSNGSTLKNTFENSYTKKVNSDPLSSFLLTSY